MSKLNAYCVVVKKNGQIRFWSKPRKLEQAIELYNKKRVEYNLLSPEPAKIERFLPYGCKTSDELEAKIINREPNFDQPGLMRWPGIWFTNKYKDWIKLVHTSAT